MQLQGFRVFDPNFFVFQYFDLDQLDLLDGYLKNCLILCMQQH